MDEELIDRVWQRLCDGIERIYARPEDFSRSSSLGSISMYVLLMLAVDN